MSNSNGTPEVKPNDKPIQDQLAEARARRELLQEQFRTHILERHLHENNILRESSYFGNRAIDPRDLLVGGDDWRPINMPIDTTTARKGGRDWPVIATEMDLDYYREQSRRLCQTNSFARGLLINLTNYIVGSGPKIKFVAREELDDDKAKAAKAAAKVGQKYLDAWAKKVKLKWRVRDIFKRMKRDGEAFTRLYPDEDHGYLELRTVEPVYIRNKPGGTQEEGWALGVRNLVHDDGSHDVETSVEYHVIFPWTLKHYTDGTADNLKRPLEDRERFTGTGEVVPAEEIVHVKNIDEDSTVKRGLPEFIFDTADACRRAASLLRNSSEGSAMRAAIAMVSQWDSATQADISTFLGAQADDLQRNPLTGNLERIQMVSGPQHLHVPKGHEFVSNPTAQGTATDPQIVQADLQMVVAAFCAPDYWTGDTNGSSYASTKEAASPIMRDAEVEQEYIADVVQEICQRALQCGIDHQWIPAEILELCEVQVEMPKLQVRDRSETITEEMQLFQSGLQSRATTQMNCGLTPHREDANIKQEQLEQAKQNPLAAMGQPGQPGQPGQQPPPGTPPGQPPAGPNGGPQIPPPPAPPPKPAAPPIPEVPPPPQFGRVKENYDPNEKRDESGKWTEGAGSGKGDKTEPISHRDRLKSAHLAHQKAKDEFRQARQEAYREESTHATSRMANHGQHVAAIQELAFNMEYPDEGPMFDNLVALDESITDMDDGEAPSERMSKLGNVIAAAKTVIAAGDYLGSGRKALKLARAARAELKAYVGHRKAMKDIKEGRFTESLQRAAIRLGIPLQESAVYSTHLPPVPVREEEDADDPQERAEAMADLLLSLYGDDAHAMFDQLGGGGSLQESYRLTEATWNPDAHPRGKGGRFIVKNSAEAVSTAKDKIHAALKQPKSKEGMAELMQHLDILSVKQIHELRKEHGISASGANRDELVKKIADRLDKGRRGETGDLSGEHPSYDDWAKGEREKNKKPEPPAVSDNAGSGAQVSDKPSAPADGQEKGAGDGAKPEGAKADKPTDHKAKWESLFTGIDSGEVTASNHEAKAKELVDAIPAKDLKPFLESVNIAQRPTSKAHAVKILSQILMHQIESKRYADSAGGSKPEGSRGPVDNPSATSQNTSADKSPEVTTDAGNEAAGQGSGTDGRRADVGGTDSGSVSGDGVAGGRKPRIVTAREHLVKPADPAVIPEGLRKHLNETQTQGAAKAIEAMDKHGGFLLADGTGTGKTRQQLAVAKRYADQGKKVLIVSPAEVIKPDWKKGTVAGSFANDSAAMGIGVTLNKDQPLKAGEVHLTTYDQLSKLKGQIDKNTTVLFDESHSLKNWGSARSKHGYEMAKAAGQVMYSTATPADKPLHITHLFRAKVFGDKKWEETYKELGMRQVDVHTGGGNYIKQWQIDPNVGHAESYRRMSGLFDRMIEDGLMLKREISLDGLQVHGDRVQLPQEAKDAVEKVYADKLKETGGNKAVALMAARMAQEVHKIPHTVKAVQEELKAGRNVVVFAARVNKSGGDDDGEEGGGEATEGTMKLLRQSLESAGIKPEHITELHGGATKTAAQKAKAMDAFQSGKAKVMLATIESGGTGVNLDDTTGDKPRSTIVITPPFSAVSNVQLAGRTWRLNTKSDAKIRHIFADTPIDDWNAALVAKKMKVHGAVVGGEAMKLDVSGDAEPEFEVGGEHASPYHWRPLVGEKKTDAPESKPIKISGDTWTHKDKIKAAGGRWDGDAKLWTIHPDKAEKLRSLTGLRFSDQSETSSAGSSKPSSVTVSGNTYEHKEKIKAAGGRWDGAKGAWVIPGHAKEKIAHLSGLRFTESGTVERFAERLSEALDLVPLPPREPAPQQMPTINITLNIPKDAINVTTPPVVVNMPEQPAPVVNVAAPVVNVAPPNITVEAPGPQSAPKEIKFIRDRDGKITGAEVEE